MTKQQALILYYQRLRTHGYNDSHSGNASVRENDFFWMTPTGACAEDTQKEDLIRCPINGDIPQGASLDAGLHQKTYQMKTDTQAILHAHNVYTVAMTMSGQDFIPIDLEGELYFPRVPVVKVLFSEHYFAQSSEKISACLSHHPVAIIQAHGVYSAGTDLNLAYKWVCSLEQSAKTAFLTQQINEHRLT